MLIKSLFYNPIGKLMKFYGIRSLNLMRKEEYLSFYNELHDRAVDLIESEDGRAPIDGEVDEIVEEWLRQFEYEPDDED